MINRLIFRKQLIPFKIFQIISIPNWNTYSEFCIRLDGVVVLINRVNNPSYRIQTFRPGVMDIPVAQRLTPVGPHSRRSTLHRFFKYGISKFLYKSDAPVTIQVHFSWGPASHRTSQNIALLLQMFLIKKPIHRWLLLKLVMWRPSVIKNLWHKFQKC